MTRRLPYDYARCWTEGCPLARRCARKQPGRPDGLQSYMAPKGGEDCEDFIDERERG